MQKKYIYIGVVVVVLGILLWVFTHKSASSPEVQTQTPSPVAESNSNICKQKDISMEEVKQTPVPAGNTAILNVRDFGEIKIQLDSSVAPKTVENFKKLIASGFYDCLTFHRIAPGFVVQGGDPKGDGTGGPGYTVPAEIKLKHVRGSLAMARLPDAVNPKKDSSGSQFYIALQDLPMLDGQYTVFGNVVSGLDIVDKIAAVELQTPGSGDGAPKTPIIIEKASIVE